MLRRSLPDLDRVVLSEAHHRRVPDDHARGLAGSNVLHELGDIGGAYFRPNLELDDGVMVNLHVQTPHVNRGLALLDEAVHLCDVGDPALVEVGRDHLFIKGLCLATVMICYDLDGERAHQADHLVGH